MTIKIKSVEKASPLDRSKKKFYPTPVRTEDITLDEMADRISAATTLNRSDIIAALDAMNEMMIQELSKGHGCKFGTLGTFSVKLKGEGSEKEKDVSSSSIYTIGVRFRPGRRLKNAMETAEFEKIAA